MNIIRSNVKQLCLACGTNISNNDLKGVHLTDYCSVLTRLRIFWNIL